MVSSAEQYQLVKRFLISALIIWHQVQVQVVDIIHTSILRGHSVLLQSVDQHVQRRGLWTCS